MESEVGVCLICGKEFVRGKHQQSKKYCNPECRIIANRINAKNFRDTNRDKINEMRREKRKKTIKVSNNQLIIKIDELARKEGLSYGQYVAKYGV